MMQGVLVLSISEWVSAGEVKNRWEDVFFGDVLEVRVANEGGVGMGLGRWCGFTA
jgi:hypothetical protein